MEDFLRALGMRNLDVGSGEARFSCPFPGHKHGDKNPACSMNVKTGTWFCHGCKRRGNAEQFLAIYEGVSPMQAAMWLAERYGGSFREPEGSMRQELDMLLLAKGKEEEWPVPIGEDLLDKMYMNWLAVWEAEPEERGRFGYPFDRGFTVETLEKFQFGWDDDTDRLVLPMRDQNGQLIGFKGRTPHKDVQPKYRVLGGNGFSYPAYKASHVVWGIHDIVGTTAVLFEGEFNAVAARQAGLDSAIGVGGSYLSKRQAELICGKVEEVVIFFDDDLAGWQGVLGVRNPDKPSEDMTGALDLLQKFVKVRVVGPHDGDPAEMPPDEIHRLVEEAAPGPQVALEVAISRE